jgi:hypothetical protein
MSEQEMKTYILTHEDGTIRKVTVPADWKVTFGPAVKGLNASNKPAQHYKIPMALRFYESDTKQRAIFTDIVSFRDEAIKIQEQVVKRQEKDGYMECDGVRKRTVFTAEVKEWINPDEAVNKPMPQLPNDAEMFCDLDD